MKKLYAFLLFILLVSCQQKNKVRFVTIDGVQIHIQEFGKGKPTVLFENGMGSSLETWGGIPNILSKETSVFLYDRAGVGKSYPSTQKRTIPNMIKELREVLHNENIRPPYIYVAHSMGSYVARFFASEYPDEIQGILLVDPSPDLMYDGYSKREYEEFEAIGDDSFKNASKGEWLEWKNYLPNRKYVQKKPISDAIPMIILSATQWDFYDFHEKIMNQHPKSKHLKIEGGHNLHEEKPELIVKLVQELIKM
ncbi:MAG: hypothetical protein CMB99_03165 [Flavobacteriaceae bacterium]|nr:hypothetical protein [Flavobacteriaceae bacterium]|tara:strand:+ start:54176 stop:54931 length:756 start_codon:yes stop_codon:yes gene_type:complete